MFKCKPRFLGNQRGYTMPEMLLSTGIMVFLLAVVFLLLTRSQGAFFDGDTNIDIRNQIRKAMARMSTEIRQTGYNSAAVAQFFISNGTGVGSSDIFTFSIPVLCASTMTTILNSSGDPAYWGAPLTWGCTTSSCMDSNNSCTILEYKSIRYQRNASNELVREVLNIANTVVSSSVLAKDISDFQLTSGGTNNREITITLTGQKTSPTKRTINVSVNQTILVSNYGT